MTIQEKTVYVDTLTGKQFNTITEARDFRESQIGQFLFENNSCINLFSPGEKLAIVNFIAANRDKLITLLEY